MRRALSCLALIGVASAVAALQAPKGPETFLDPEKAGPDFRAQGEYAGTIDGGAKLAAQVVAEGAGKFAVHLLPGGLPGDGWDGKTRHTGKAVTDGGRTPVALDRWEARIEDGKLVGKTPEGRPFALARVVRKSPTEGRKPPPGAVVLFDGTGTDEWKGGKLAEDTLLAPGAETARNFGDFQLHLEYRQPYRPAAKGQSRGNSGVYLQRRYEVQILDSFGMPPKNNEGGAIYTQTPPSVNMCYPPLQWQTYDIDFKAARFDAGGKKVADAVVTVRHNGVTVHDAVAVKGPTGHGRKEEPTPGPLLLQNHGNPVYFRNVWLVPGKE